MLLAGPQSASADPGSGTAAVSPPDSVEAGSFGTWTFRYTTIDTFSSGVVELVIPNGWSSPQDADPNSTGYVTVFTNGSGTPSLGISAMTVTVYVDTLMESEWIEITYGDSAPSGRARADTVAQTGVEFIVRSDPLDSLPTPVTPSPMLDIVAGPVDLEASRLASMDSPAVADSIDAVLIAVTVLDAFGNAINGEDVTLDVSPLEGTYWDDPGHSDIYGEATGSIYSTVAGTKVVSAYVDEGSLEDNVHVDFVAGSVDTSRSYIHVLENPTVVKEEADTIHVVVMDVYGNSIGGKEVVLELVLGDGTVDPPSDTTDTNGVAVFTLASTVSGTKALRASVDGSYLEDAVDVVFQPGTPFSINALPSDTTAEAGSYVRYRLYIEDEFGNASPVSFEQTISLFSEEGSFHDISDSTVTSTLNIPAGGDSAHVFFRSELKNLNGDDIFFLDDDEIPPQIGWKRVTIRIDHADPDTVASELSTSPKIVIADGIDPTTASVVVRDQFGNTVDGVPVSVSVSPVEGTNVDPPVKDSGSDGVAEFAVRSTTAAEKIISADVNGRTIADTDTVTFIAGEVNADSSSVTPDTNRVTANGTDSVEITVIVRDDFGNPVIDAQVTLSASGEDNSPVDPGHTDSNGVAVGYVKSTKAQIKNITASAGQVTISDVAQVEFVADAVDHFLITHDGAATAGIYENIDIEALDLFENRVTWFTDTISVYTNTSTTGDFDVQWARGPGAINDPIYLAADTATYEFDPADNGRVTLSVSDTRAESITIFASYNTVTSQSATPLSVAPAAADSIVVVSGDGQNADVDTPVPYDLVVAVKDEYGNSVEDETVTFSVMRPAEGVIDTDPGSPGIDSTAATRTDGRASCPYWRLGHTSGTGTDEVRAYIAGGIVNEVTFTASADPGPPTSVDLKAGSEIVTVGTSTTVTATLLDEFGNGVVDEPLIIFIADGLGLDADGSLSNDPASPTDWAGPYARVGNSGFDGTISVIYNAPSVTGMSDTIDALHSVIQSSEIDDVVITSSSTGTATQLYVTLISGATSEAGEIFSFRVQAVDGNLNLDSANTSHIVIDSSSAGEFTFSESSDFSATTFETDLENGERILYGRANKAGTWNVAVTDAASLLAPGVLAVTIEPDSTVSYYDVYAPAGAIAGRVFWVRAEARDEYGNLVTTAGYGISLEAVLAADSLVTASDTLSIENGTLFDGVFEEYNERYHRAESIQVKVTDGIFSAEGYSDTITIDHAAAYRIAEVTGDATGITVGERVQIEGRVYDAFGNPVDDKRVVFSNPRGNGALDATELYTDNSGLVSNGYQTGNTVGLNRVKAVIDNGNPPGLKVIDFDITTVPKDSIAYCEVVVHGSSFPAGDTFSVDVSAFDEFDNLIVSDDTTHLVPAGEAPTLVFIPETVVLDGGQPAFEAYGTAVGQNRIAMKRLDETLLPNYSNPFTITQGPAYRISYVSGSATGVVAGASVPLTVLVEDSFSNPVDGKPVHFRIENNRPGNPRLVPSSGIVSTSTGGSATCTLFTNSNAGTDSVYATIDNGDPDSLEQILFNIETIAGTIFSYTIEPVDAGYTRAAGEYFKVRVIGYDDKGNRAYGDDTTQVQLGSESGSAWFFRNRITLSNGSDTVTVRDTMAETLVLTAQTFPAGASDASEPFTILPAAPASTIEAESIVPPIITANDINKSLITTAPIRDEYNNVVAAGELVTVSTDSGEITSDDRDPPPGREGIQRQTEQDGRVLVYLQAGLDPATATVQFQSENGTAAGTAQVIFAPPPLCEYGEYLEPEIVQPANPVQFRCAVENLSETSVIVDTDSYIEFTDDIHTYRSNLAQPDTIQGSETDTLEFSVEPVDPDMLSGRYTPTIGISGIDQYGSNYRTQFSGGSNSIIVSRIEVIQISAPPIVSRGEKTVIGARLKNTGEVSITIRDVEFLFGNGSGELLDVCTPTLPDVLPSGLERVYSCSTQVNFGAPLGTDVISAVILGTINGDTIVAYSMDEEKYTTWEVRSEARISYEEHSMSPSIVSTGQTREFSVRLHNEGQSDVILDESLTSLSFTDGIETVSVALGTGGGLWGESTVELQFPPAQVVTAPGKHEVVITIHGMEYGAPFDTSFALDDSILVVSPAALDYVNGSLVPQTVSNGRSVAFSIDVNNTGGAAVACNHDSTFFVFGSDPEDPEFRAPLNRDRGVDIAAGDTTTLIFTSNGIPTELPTAQYVPTVEIRGTENDVGFETELTLSNDPITVLSPPDLVINEVRSSVSRVTADQEKTWNLTINVANNGEALVSLDNLEVLFFDESTDVTHQYELTVANFTPGELLNGNTDKDIFIEIWDNGENAMTPSTVIVDATAWGTEQITQQELPPATTGPGTRGSFLVQTRAAPVVVSVEPSIQQVSALQDSNWTVDVTLKNEGQSDIRLILDAFRTHLTFSEPADFVALTPASLLGGGDILEGGSTDVLRFTVDTTGSVAGIIDINVQVDGVEINSDRPIGTIGAIQGARVEVQEQAELAITRLSASRDRVTIGQDGDWHIEMVLRNDGGSTLSIHPDNTDSTWIAVSGGTGPQMVRPEELEGGGIILEPGEIDSLRFDVVTTLSVSAGVQVITGAVVGHENNSGRIVYDAIPGGPGSGIVTFQRRPEPVYVATSLSPDTVSLGTAVSFELFIESGDTDHATLVLDPVLTRVSFNDGLDEFTAPLSPSSDNELLGGEATMLKFENTAVDEAIELGSYSLDVHLIGSENGNVFDTVVTTWEDEVDVIAAPDLSINTILVPSTVTADQQRPWQARMVLQNNGEAPVELDLAEESTNISFFIFGVKTSDYDISYPESLQVAGGSVLSGGGVADTLVFTINRTGSTTGAAIVHGEVKGRDSYSSDIRGDNTYSRGGSPMRIQAPGVPEVTLTTTDRVMGTVTSGQSTPWNITIEVCNIGGATLELDMNNTLVYADAGPLSQTKPPRFDEGDDILPGGECRHLTFEITPTPDIPGGADLTLHARVTFVEQNSGQTIYVDTGEQGSGEGTIRVQAPAELRLAELTNASFNAPFVNRGQYFPVILRIENEGEAAVDSVFVSLTTNGTSNIENAPVVIEHLDGSTTATDTFFVTATDISGSETFEAAIASAVDVNSRERDLYNISTAIDDTTTAEIREPGSLIVIRTYPSQPEVNSGQDIPYWNVWVVLENNGDAPVTIAAPSSDDDIMFYLESTRQLDYAVDPPTAFASGSSGWTLTGGLRDSLSYTVTSTGLATGSVSVTATVSWSDGNDPHRVTAPAQGETSVEVTEVSGVRITEVTSNAPNRDDFNDVSTVNIGQMFDITVTVTNIGGDALDSVQVELTSSRPSDSSATSLQGPAYRSVEKDSSVNYVFDVTASSITGAENLSARITKAVSRVTGMPVVPLPPVHPIEILNIQTPAVVSCSLWVSAPPGAVDDTISTGQMFDVTVLGTKNGEASIDDTGQITLTVPPNFIFINPSEPTTTPFVPNEEYTWTLVARPDPSDYNFSARINHLPIDVNTNESAAVTAEQSDITIVVEDSAHVEQCVIAVSYPEGAIDGTLSTDQTFHVRADVRASANAENVWAELTVPPGFTIVGNARREIGNGGSDTSATWTVSAPVNETDGTITASVGGSDGNSGMTFQDACASPITVNVVEKARLELKARITSPDAALDGSIPTGLEFTIEASVTNRGRAGVDTTDARIGIVLPEGWEESLTSAGDTTKPFIPGTPVVWNLVAPGSSTDPGSIVIRFVARFATDENTNKAATLENVSDGVEVITEVGQIFMLNISELEAIPPKVVPQGAEDVPMLRMEFTNNLDQRIGLDMLYVSVKNKHGQLLDNPAAAVSSMTARYNGEVYSETVGGDNPVPMIIDHAFYIDAGNTDTLLLSIDIAQGAPAGGLHIDAARSSADVVFTIGNDPGGTWVSVALKSGEEFPGHFMSTSMQIMSANFEEYAHNYPNPFRAGTESTKISYFLTRDSSVSMRVYALTGELVWSKNIGAGEPGGTGTEGGTWHEVEWNGYNDKGELVRNGVYLCKIEAGSQSAVFKIAVAK